MIDEIGYGWDFVLIFEGRTPRNPEPLPRNAKICTIRLAAPPT